MTLADLRTELLVVALGIGLWTISTFQRASPFRATVVLPKYFRKLFRDPLDGSNRPSVAIVLCALSITLSLIQIDKLHQLLVMTVESIDILTPLLQGYARYAEAYGWVTEACVSAILGFCVTWLAASAQIFYFEGRFFESALNIVLVSWYSLVLDLFLAQQSPSMSDLVVIGAAFATCRYRHALTLS